MAYLEFAREEVEELRSILEDYLSGLRREIADTGNREFRRNLRKREAFVDGLLKQLEAKATLIAK